MAVALNIKATGLPRARKLFRDLEYAALDMRPAWGKVAQEFYRQERKQFDSRGRRRWPPIDRDTIRIRRSRGGSGRKVMIDSGALRRSLTSAVAAGSVRRFQPQEMEVGTSLPYAAMHQFRNGRRFRKPIDLKPADKNKFARIVREWIIASVDR